VQVPLQSFSQGILNVRRRVFCMNSWRETQSVPSERYEKRSLLLLWFGGERARHAPLPTSSWHRQLATNPHNVCVSRGVQHEPQRAVRGGGGGGVERTGTRRLCTRAQDSLVRLHCALESFHANNRAYECKDGCEVYFSFWFIVHRLCIDSFRWFTGRVRV